MLAAAPASAESVSTAPTIGAIRPAAGTSVGGTVVTVRGTGFGPGTVVRFGAVRASAVHVLSATRLRLHAPSHAAGSVRVRVQTAAGTSNSSAADRFVFRSPLVVIDPGHNGGNGSHRAVIDRLVNAGYGERKPCNTTGTATNPGYPEYAYNWDVSVRVRKILRAHHVSVRFTHANDKGVGPCVNVRARLQSAKGVAAAVAIHADGAPSGGHGFHVNEDSRRPVGASRATVARSTRLGRDLVTSLARYSGLTRSTYIGHKGWVTRDDLAGLNLSTKPTSFLELGNMRNAGDAAKQRSAAGRQRIARAVAIGILDYLRG
jgi:N-acetylmuramoyl-L-alanine amidase